MSYTNADGLYVRTFKDQGAVFYNGGDTESGKSALVFDIPDATKIGATAAAPIPLDGFIPANAFITRAYFVATTAFTSGGAATLDIGLYNAAGTAINATGIAAAIALASINTAGKAVAATGALANNTSTIGAADAYIGVKYNTAAYTAGAGKLVIEFRKL